MSTLHIAVCQTEQRIGNFAHNISVILRHFDQACSRGAHIAVFGECSLCGYYARDLFLDPQFIIGCERALEAIKIHTIGKDCTLIIGTPSRNPKRDKLFNSAIVIRDGSIVSRTHKYALADESICEDHRFFTPATTLPDVVKVKEIKIGVCICHDIWSPIVAKHLKDRGAALLLIVNSSPFYVGKASRRIAVAKKRVQENGIPLLYVNVCSGVDGVLFDGSSFGINHDGEKFFQAPPFTQGIYSTLFTKTGGALVVGSATDNAPLPATMPCLWDACCFGLKSYVQQTGFTSVVLGLSGGIDSAVTCAMAADAIGSKNVVAVIMPSPYTAKDSLHLAKKCAQMLGVQYQVVPITSIMGAFDALLSPLFQDREKDETEENIQSRIRGNILMAMSNKFSHLVISTGNKSESAVGYTTLYGDMCGGFNLLKDIYKTEVFDLAKWRNQQQTVIPEAIIKKPPTAELRSNQKDQDSLPPYALLDRLLTMIVEEKRSIQYLKKAGFSMDMITSISQLLHNAEHKRKQSSIGIKLSKCSFDNDRRYPICEDFSHYGATDRKKRDC